MGSFRLRGLCTDATSALRKTALGSPERFFFVLCFWCIPCFTPCRGRLTFFVLPKKVSKERRAEMAKDSFNFRNRAESGKTRCAQTVPRLFSARLRKLKAPSRAGTSTTKPVVCVSCRSFVSCGVLLRFARYLNLFLLLCLASCRTSHYCGCASMVWPYLALDGALNFCCREEKGRETV